MELLVRPKPNKDYFNLTPRQATAVAIRLARMYGKPGKPDMSVYLEFTKAYGEKWVTAQGQMTLV